jgi:hypothetical protein
MKPFQVRVCVFSWMGLWAFVSADNGALSFDGINDFARTQATAADIPVGNASYTQELWVNVQGWPAYGNGYEGFLLSRGTEGPHHGVHIVLLNHHVGLTHWIPDTDTGIALEDHRWYHIATTYDGFSEKLYVDGQLRWESPITSGLAVQPTPITLGRHNNYFNYFFQGFLDEVRIWNYVRSAEEIAANADRQMDPTSPGLVAYWRMDEAGGQVLTDSSASLNAAILGDTLQPAIDDPTRIGSELILESFCGTHLTADINFDCTVNLDDLLSLAEKWLALCNPLSLCGHADIDLSSRVDLADLALLASEWMK